MENSQAEAEQADRRGGSDSNGADDGDGGSRSYFPSFRSPKQADERDDASLEGLQKQIDDLKAQIEYPDRPKAPPVREDIPQGHVLMEDKGYRLVYEPRRTEPYGKDPQFEETFNHKPYIVRSDVDQRQAVAPTEGHGRRLFAHCVKRRNQNQGTA